MRSCPAHTFKTMTYADTAVSTWGGEQYIFPTLPPPAAVNQEEFFIEEKEEQKEVKTQEAR